MKIMTCCISALFAFSALPAAETDVAKESELIVERARKGDSALAGSIDRLATLEGEQLMGSLPQVLEILEADPSNQLAINRLLIGLRRSERLIPDDQMKRVAALAAGGSGELLELLRHNQKVLTTLADERATPPAGK